MARPRKKIDIAQLEQLAERQWSVRQIASFFRVSHDTLQRRYASIIADARLRGSAKIIDLQWKRAMEGSDTMIKHMAEHYLGQSSKSTVEVSGKDGQAIPLTLTDMVKAVEKAERDEKK